VSEWGHDFRPDYRRLRGGFVRCRTAAAAARPPMAAFTATATPEVRDDIVACWGLRAEGPRRGVRPAEHPSARGGGGGRSREGRAAAAARGGRRALVYAATRRNDRGRVRRAEGRRHRRRGVSRRPRRTSRTRVQDGSRAARCASSARRMPSGWGSTGPTSRRWCTTPSRDRSRRTTRRSGARAATAVRRPRRCSGLRRRRSAEFLIDSPKRGSGPADRRRSIRWRVAGGSSSST
jgi:hypothetical protein